MDPIPSLPPFGFTRMCCVSAARPESSVVRTEKDPKILTGSKPPGQDSDSRMPSSALIPFFGAPGSTINGALGSPINPFKQKRGTLFNPRLLGNLGFPLSAAMRRFGDAVCCSFQAPATPETPCNPHGISPNHLLSSKVDNL